MDRFLKGIIVGLGGVAPGLSGTVLLIIFGLYQKTLDSLGHILVDFRKNIRFLLPLLTGMGLGVLLFSRLIDWCMTDLEVPTRFCFLGLILGTVPMVWRDVRREGLKPWHSGLVLLSAAGSLCFFALTLDGLPTVTHPSLWQSVLLGVAVAATAIIPGLDPAVFLSTLGFYEMYVGALADLNLRILLPMLLGLGTGAIGISLVMNWLFKRAYTATYCVIFGIFLAMIPNMLTPECTLGLDLQSVFALVLLVLGVLVSYFLGDIQGNLQLLRKLMKKKKP